MSWFFAFSRQHSNLGFPEVPYETKPLLTLSFPSLDLALGGVKETCLYEHNEVNGRGWGMVGVGVQHDEGITRIMTLKDWRLALEDPKFNPTSLDGHFIALRWNRDQIEFFNDQIGMRTLYYGSTDTGLCISTRLDWVTTFSNTTEINVSCLGSRWFMLNQLSFDSCINGVERLGSNGYLNVSRGRIEALHSEPWLPKFQEYNASDAVRSLETLIEALVQYPMKLALGLSGGFDSRFLLALLLDAGRDLFGVYTVGEPGHPDVQIATKIAGRLGLQHQHIHEPLPDPDNCMAMMSSYAVRTHLIEAVSTVSKLRYSSKLRTSGCFAIDGGFGEIGRRGLFKRLERFGKKGIYEKDASQLADILWLNRAPIFAPDVQKTMRAGAVEELQGVLDKMPSAKEIGLANFVDLFSMRTRVPNYGGPEQSRLDAEVLIITPFIQPSYVQTVINVSASERVNGRFYNRVIRERAPQLTRFSLVKGSITYPYSLALAGNVAWLIAAIKKRVGAVWSDPIPDRLLLRVKEPVLDLLHSSEIMTSPLYDVKRVVSSVKAYYNGEKRLRGFVDWWLTFELWRKSMVGNS